ncbi:hypothetical protein [Nitrospirillum pindoramense]|nr:hypothetical protein [Nitrospirillum amazonense]
MMPFEHFDSIRSQQFPHSCDVAQLTGTARAKVAVRLAPGHYPNPYNIVTRERGELFIYGGYVGDKPESDDDNEEAGSYVARLDADTLEERWRVHFKVPFEHYFDWPGVLGVHGNGFLYVVTGAKLAKIDPATGAHRTIDLPEHPGGFGAAYNGFVISRSGDIIAKSLERGRPLVNSLPGLYAVKDSGIPAFLVSVDADTLEIKAVVETPEPVLGRVMVDGQAPDEFVYLPGLTHVWRYRLGPDSLTLDPSWNPQYVFPGEQPGPACGMLNGWVVVQTNFLEAKKPLRISAFHSGNAALNHHHVPFPHGAPSEEYSKPALDAAHNRIYTSDEKVGLVTALDFKADVGFVPVWQQPQTMDSFWAVVGPRQRRNIIGTDYLDCQDYVVWRDADTGVELARSGPLDARLNGNIVAIGFDGRFYYLGVNDGTVNELTLKPA